MQIRRDLICVTRRGATRSLYTPVIASERKYDALVSEPGRQDGSAGGRRRARGRHSQKWEEERGHVRQKERKRESAPDAAGGFRACVTVYFEWEIPGDRKAGRRETPIADVRAGFHDIPHKHIFINTHHLTKNVADHFYATSDMPKRCSLQNFAKQTSIATFQCFFSPFYWYKSYRIVELENDVNKDWTVWIK